MDSKVSVVHVIEIQKFAQRGLNEEANRRTMTELIGSVNTEARLRRGWRMDLRPIDGSSTEWYRVEHLSESSTGPRNYHFFLNFTCNDSNKDDGVELETVLTQLDAKGASYQGNPYTIEMVDGEKYNKQSLAAKRASKSAKADLIGYAPFSMPEDTAPYFSKMYGVSSQIRLVLKAISRAMESNWKFRFNTLLVGPPGCGKTELLRCIKEMVGNPSVIEVDAPAMTAAGFQKLFDPETVEEIARLIFVEEIEKASSEVLVTLLSMGDSRGEVRKVTARGNIMRDTKVLMFATCNDFDKFGSVQSGALKSRFSNTIWFNRPDDNLLTLILKSKLDEFAGDGTEGSGKKCYKWIKPALAWCHEVDNLDPRYAISVCINGGDDWLTGEYRADLLATQQPEDVDLVEFNS